tara:strand:- start:3268 stop:3705 length:438 start_codon:yes stop_codon:yes gene_type:complete
MSAPSAAKKRIAQSRRLYEISDHLDKSGKLPDKVTWADVRRLSKAVLRGMQATERQAAADRQRALNEKDIMRNEMHVDVVDREANAARIAERQRFLFERSSANQQRSSSFEYAPASASYVEAALVALCTHTHAPSRGSQIASQGE